MTVAPWNTATVKLLQDRDENAWQLFANQALDLIRSYLASSVAASDLDDECMAVMVRICRDLANWEASGPQSLKSFILMKAVDRRKRYLSKKAKQPPTESLEALAETMAETASDAPDPEQVILHVERDAAITEALAQMESEEARFCRLRSEGHSPAEAAGLAGYPPGESPENLAKRAKGKLKRALIENSYFAANPDELARMGIPANTGRNYDA